MKRNPRMVWHTEGVQKVLAILRDCSTIKEIELIFDRVLTTREINDIARRFEALAMIDEGKSYADIHMRTGMSPNTIARLSAKCGFGFRKSSGISKPKMKSDYRSKRIIRYKGVPVATIRK